jgi:hypothetical protein
MQARDVLVQRVDGDRERQIALVLGRPTLQHEQRGSCGRARLLGDRGQQRALADPGLAEHGQDARAAIAYVVERARHRAQFPIAADQLHDTTDDLRPRLFPGRPEGGGSGDTPQSGVPPAPS